MSRCVGPRARSSRRWWSGTGSTPTSPAPMPRELPSLLVLCGVNTADDAIFAIPEERPTYLADDLRALTDDPDALRVGAHPAWRVDVGRRRRLGALHRSRRRRPADRRAGDRRRRLGRGRARGAVDGSSRRRHRPTGRSSGGRCCRPPRRWRASVNHEMSTDPEQIRAQVAELLGEPDPSRRRRRPGRRRRAAWTRRTTCWCRRWNRSRRADPRDAARSC